MKDANPGQVLQITPDAAAATKLNTYMHYILKQYDAKSPWQYYNLIDVQWARVPVVISDLKVAPVISDLKAPVTVPLPDGTPNVPAAGKDMLNPVLETFLQLPYPPPANPQHPGLSCLACHQYAATTKVGNDQASFAASYSFMFGRASAPPKEAH